MPRSSATHTPMLIAIACSAHAWTSAERPTSGPIMTSDARPKRMRDRGGPKKILTPRATLTELENVEYPMSCTSWDMCPSTSDIKIGELNAIEEAVDIIAQGNATHAGTYHSESLRQQKGKSKVSNAAPEMLPEDLQFRIFGFVATTGRLLSRAGRLQCDPVLREQALLPTFPVAVLLKQHMRIGSETISTNYSVSVASPLEEATIEISINGYDSTEEHCQHSKQRETSSWVQRLCKDLRERQSTFGTTYKEEHTGSYDEASVVDADGRVLIEHTYERRVLRSKADELTEMFSDLDWAMDQGCSSTVHTTTSHL